MSARVPDRPGCPQSIPAPRQYGLSPSLMPAASRCSGVMRLCVVEAGWVIVVLVSPRLAVIDSIRVASISFQAASLPPLSSNATMPPPVFCCAIASACCGCDGKPGYSTRATCGCASSHCASASALFECASMRIESVSRPFRITQALNADSVGPGSPQKGIHAFHQGLAAQDRAAQHPALAIEILGRGMNHDIGIQFQRLLQRRRTKAVIDCKPRAAIHAQSPPAHEYRSLRSADWTATRQKTAWYSV